MAALSLTGADGDVETVEYNYNPYGAAKQLFECRDLEVCLDGPAGTGKTLAALNKIHAALLKYPGARALIARKRNTDLTNSALVTLRERVLQPDEGVEWFGGNKLEPACFRYPNGSRLVVNGLDRAEKVKSAEFDLAYINEATECSEEDCEFVRSRLRHGTMPYQQLILDCNPGAPSHWLNQRMNPLSTTFDPSVHKTRRLLSRHEDNPRYFDRATQQWTQEGKAYIEENLGGLTGVRLLRLRDGKWAAAEGTVYDEYDPKIHLVPRRPIPKEWPRYWAVDFGYGHPFVWQAWAIDPDGRPIRYHEIYWTQRLVEDHAKDILRVVGYEVRGLQLVRLREDAEPLPRAIICDHDAEDRKTLEKYLRLTTTLAYKDMSRGTQAVKSRLRVAGDGKPRVFFMEDSLVQRDPELLRAKKPTCTEDEFESYVWDLRGGRKAGDEPIDEDNHGLDCLRYLIAHFDCHTTTAAMGPKVNVLPRVGLYRP